MTNRALVTGGAGFIGCHLVERLLDDGHEVTVIDDFSTGRPENLAHLRDRPGLRVIEGDICEPDALAKAFDGAEWVFHLAALADIVPSIQAPVPYHRANVEGTLAVLEAARAAGVKRLVYAASSSCYGVPDVFPTPESAPIRPMYPYALTKNIAEQYVMHWHQTYGLPAVSLRFFNVYGPRARTSGTYGAVFGVFLAQKLAGRPFTVVGDGTQTRDFTFVTDVVEAFILAARSDLAGEILNVGSGDSYSVNRLVELLGGEVIYVPKRPGEPDRTWGDTTRIEERLGWGPKITFEEGVARMVEEIEYWREAPVWTPETIVEATADWFRYLGAAKP
ncbi:MAG: SDR family oxidoreductase [Proteobacteria bacterium]|nr:SDR family oxidoreductase [Pseudomonadota bacterium]